MVLSRISLNMPKMKITFNYWTLLETAVILIKLDLSSPQYM